MTTTFFAALDVPLLAGRFFDSTRCGRRSPVLIVNARASQQLFGGPTAAVGQRLSPRCRAVAADRWCGRQRAVVVLQHARVADRSNSVSALCASLHAPSTIHPPTSFGFNLHIRSNRASSLADVSAAASSVSSRAAVTELQRVSDAIGIATRQPALRMRLLFSLSIASLLLAAIGVYGIVSQAVAYRRREVAIRIAVGAAPMRIIATMTRNALVTGFAGLIVGVLPHSC